MRLPGSSVQAARVGIHARATHHAGLNSRTSVETEKKQPRASTTPGSASSSAHSSTCGGDREVRGGVRSARPAPPQFVCSVGTQAGATGIRLRAALARPWSQPNSELAARRAHRVAARARGAAVRQQQRQHQVALLLRRQALGTHQPGHSARSASCTSKIAAQRRFRRTVLGRAMWPTAPAPARQAEGGHSRQAGPRQPAPAPAGAVSTHLRRP